MDGTGQCKCQKGWCLITRVAEVIEERACSWLRTQHDTTALAMIPAQASDEYQTGRQGKPKRSRHLENLGWAMTSRCIDAPPVRFSSWRCTFVLVCSSSSFPSQNRQLRAEVECPYCEHRGGSAAKRNGASVLRHSADPKTQELYQVKWWPGRASRRSLTEGDFV